jgi:hypothetical protein
MKTMKNWEKPQLIIIGRANVEENVLKGCKAIGATFAPSPEAVAQTGCDTIDAGNCGACKARSGSGS